MTIITPWHFPSHVLNHENVFQDSIGQGFRSIALSRLLSSQTCRVIAPRVIREELPAGLLQIPGCFCLFYSLHPGIVEVKFLKHFFHFFRVVTTHVAHALDFTPILGGDIPHYHQGNKDATKNSRDHITSFIVEPSSESYHTGLLVLNNSY